MKASDSNEKRISWCRDLQLLLSERSSAEPESRRIAIGSLALTLRLSENFLVGLIIGEKQISGIELVGDRFLLNSIIKPATFKKRGRRSSAFMAASTDRTSKRKLSSIGYKIKYLYWLKKGCVPSSNPKRMSLKRLRVILTDQEDIESIPDPEIYQVWMQNDGNHAQNLDSTLQTETNFQSFIQLNQSRVSSRSRNIFKITSKGQKNKRQDSLNSTTILMSLPQKSMNFDATLNQSSFFFD